MPSPACPTVPWQCSYTTNGHSSPANDWDELAGNERIRRWFDHYLKGMANGVQNEPRFDVSYPPVEPGQLLTPTVPWPHAMLQNWPPPNTTTQTLYLRDNGSSRGLAGSPPNAVEPSAVVANQPLNGYGMTQYLMDNRNPVTVEGRFVPDVETFPGAPLAEDLELIGRPRFRAVVDCTAGDFYLTARLWSVEPGINGIRRMLTAGTHGVRGGQPGPHTLDIELEDIAMVVPAGNHLELELTNLSIYKYPQHWLIRWVPCFDPSTTSVHLSPATPARLELPMRAKLRGAIAPRFRFLHTQTPSQSPILSWPIAGGTQRAGSFYMVLMSGSGFAPGTSFGSVTVPLNLDFWTYAVVGAAPGPFFTGFKGVLDNQGHALATLDLTGVPIPAALLGTRFSMAVLGLDGNGYWGGGLAEFDLVP
ncbi:MAG: hypothetical protein KDC98_10290 [Planctomycetes bacterium]|nr:hypothetical protein [Planctomycetota bacterium]